MHKDDGIKRVQSFIRKHLEGLETVPGWKALHPVLANEIRKAVVRLAWDSYKSGMLVHECRCES